ncbi:hypothetical protein ACE1OE_00655 [Vibrio sp. E150_011]
MKKLLVLTTAISAIAGFNVQASTDSTAIDIKADIPAIDFHFRPVSVISGEQEMSYNMVTQTLSGLSFDFSYAVGMGQAINAQVTSTLALTESGGKTIDLKATVGGIEIDNAAKEIIAADTTASQAGQTKLVIEPVTEIVDNSTKSGVYTGTVEIEFNAAVATAP